MNGVYEMVEIANSEDSKISVKNPGDRIVLSGRAIKELGIGPIHPIGIGGEQVYEFSKIADHLPKSRDANYDAMLTSSLIRYRRYGPVERFNNSFVSNEIVRALSKGKGDKNSHLFSILFKKLAKIVEENDNIEVGDLSSVFGDVLIYKEGLRNALHQLLIDIALASQKSNALASRTAVKILRSSDIGEVVLVSPEAWEGSGTGGLATYISDLTKQLAALGINVTLLLPMFAFDKEKIMKEISPRDTGRTVTVKFNADGSESAVIKLYQAKKGGLKIEGEKDAETAKVKIIYLRE